MKARLLPTLLFSLVLCAPAFADVHRGWLVPGADEHPDVVDLNGDGLTDLLQQTQILLNTGGGAFVAHSLGLDEGDYVLDVLDVNGDGRLDLLTTYGTATVPGGTPAPKRYFVYMATGTLAYAPKVRLPIANYATPYIADVNDDGKDDLVQLSRIEDDRSISIASEWKVLLSRGDGTFAAREPFRLAPNPQFGLFNFNYRLLAGDVDRDGHTDLVVRFPNHLAVLTGIGGGDFGAPRVRFLPRHFGYTSALHDVNRDGNPDLVFGGNRMVHVFLNDGQGNFPRATSEHLRKTHATVIPDYIFGGARGNSPDDSPQPRKFGFGEFVKQGRTEIATTTNEGDVVILALENNELREIEREVTEYLAPDAYAGSFRTPGRTDLLVTWNWS